MNNFKKMLGFIAFTFSISSLAANISTTKEVGSVLVNGKTFEEFISYEQIQKRIKEMGEQIRNDYKESTPLFIGILKGSVIFLSDLVREVPGDCEIDFMKISSYGNSMQSSGEIKLLEGISKSIEGRDVIIVEDVIDSGRSITFLKNYLGAQNPKSLKIAALLKKDCVKLDFAIDYVGFEIPPDFVVGCGLDYAQMGRNLKSIYKLSTN